MVINMAQTKKIPFKKLKIGQEFWYAFEYSWKNSFGKFYEKKVDVFKKIDKTLAYSEIYQTGIEPKPDELVEIFDEKNIQNHLPKKHNC